MSATDLGALRELALADPAGAIAQLERLRTEGSVLPGHAYLHAQLLAMRGRPEDALELIDEAELGFRNADALQDAARCDAGRSNVLDDLGRHDEAIAAAQRWAAWLEHEPPGPSRQELLAQALANLGTQLESAGEYVAALAVHDRAISSMTESGDDELLATFEINRANVLNLLGRSPEAFAALEWAAAVFEASGNDEDLVGVCTNAGESLCRMGRPDDGLDWFARAERLVERGSLDHAVLLVETADALSALGAVEQASALYAEAFELLEATPVAWLEARAWTGAAAAALALGRSTEASAALERASGLHLAAGNLPAWAVTESDALAVLDPHHEGRGARVQTLVELAGDVDELAWPVQATHVHLVLAELRADDRVAAAQDLERAVELAERTGVPHMVVRARHRRGRMLFHDGRIDEADAELVAALETADRIRGRLTADDVLQSFPATVADAHEALVSVRLAQGRVAEAFELADVGRSRALVDLGAPLDTRARSQQQAADTAELDQIYDRLLSMSDSVALDLRRQLDQRAHRLEERLGRFDLQRSRRRTRAVRQTPDATADDEVTAMYRVVGDEVELFVATAAGVSHHRAVAPLSRIADALERFRSLGRRALAIAAAAPERLAQMETAANAQLAELGGVLLAPLDEELRGACRLVVVPHGLLHGVPFHALVGERDEQLLDRVEVAVTPSLALRDMRRNEPEPDGRTLVVGRQFAELPGVTAELDAIVALVPDAIALRDAAATVAAVTRAMPGSRCIHLASHGLFRAGAPLQSGIRLADGWLTARHVSQLDLTGSIVVLSACDTGRSVVQAGDELLGLQRGFLLAGARAVVMSQWPAVDEVTPALMTTFHEHVQAGRSVPSALRASWMAARRLHSHPWWWAPFFVSGT